MAMVGAESGTSGAETAAGKKIRVGNIGTGVRGTELVRGILDFPDVEVPALCDIDKGRLDNACKMVEDITGRRPEPLHGR